MGVRGYLLLRHRGWGHWPDQSLDGRVKEAASQRQKQLSKPASQIDR